jgi:ADP-heptose:LPS heptosyltransferase
MRILILHAGALGDCVLTIHLARALRRAGHTISLAARSLIATWAARHGMLDQAIPLDRLAPVLWGTGDPLGRPPDLLDGFDAVISFLGGPQDTANSRLIDLLGDRRVIAFDPRPTVETLNMGRHITKQWIDDLIEAAPRFVRSLFDCLQPVCRDDPKASILNKGGLRGDGHHDFIGTQVDLESQNENQSPSHTLQTRQATTRAESHDPEKRTCDSRVPNFIIHPGSGGRDKCCPLDALEVLMQQLRQSGANACWMIGPDEMERDGPSLSSRLERSARVIFEESLDRVADLAATADAYIGNDSGMTHVAALTGVNTVALFGPTDPRVWRPLGIRCTVHRFPSDKSDTAWIASVSGSLADRSN